VEASPVVSVVVATHDRRFMLARLLEALDRQDGVGPYEVVVVDDASVDGTFSELRRLEGLLRVPLRPIRLERNGGPARARNVGWQAASAPLVAFTDDDCVPEPGWLAALVEGLAEADVVQGRTLPIPEREAGRGPFARTLWVEEERGFYETCNIAYRRSLLERLGGFDESFGTTTGGPVWGEDTDLAWRAKELGARTTFCADALVRHEVFRSDYRAYLRDALRRGGLVRNVRRHPGLRRSLHGSLVSQPSHGRAVLAAAGVASALARSGGRLRPVAAAAAAAPYLWYRVVERPWPCRPRNLVPVLALGFAADLAEAAVMLAASVGQRTLVV
jgi:glycosyltransferase involved in cell wall biosynthesis